MVWLIIPNITQLLEFDSLELHHFNCILYAYRSCVFVYLYSKRAPPSSFSQWEELNFHSSQFSIIDNGL